MNNEMELAEIEKELLVQRIGLIEVEEFITTLEHTQRVLEAKTRSEQEKNLLLASINPKHMDLLRGSNAFEGPGNLGLLDLAGRAIKATYEFFKGIVLAVGRWLGLVNDSKYDNARKYASSSHRFFIVESDEDDPVTARLKERIDNATDAMSASESLEDLYKAYTEFTSARINLFKLHPSTQDRNISNLNKNSKNKAVIGVKLTFSEIEESLENVRRLGILQTERINHVFNVCKAIADRRMKLDHNSVLSDFKDFSEYISKQDDKVYVINTNTKFVPVVKDRTSDSKSVLYFKMNQEPKGNTTVTTELTDSQIYKLLASAGHLMINYDKRVDSVSNKLDFIAEMAERLTPYHIADLKDKYGKDKNTQEILLFVSSLMETAAMEKTLTKNLLQLTHHFLNEISVRLPTI